VSLSLKTATRTHESGSFFLVMDSLVWLGVEPWFGPGVHMYVLLSADIATVQLQYVGMRTNLSLYEPTTTTHSLDPHPQATMNNMMTAASVQTKKVEDW
jgi:hypothetical protein